MIKCSCVESVKTFTVSVRDKCLLYYKWFTKEATETQLVEVSLMLTIFEMSLNKTLNPKMSTKNEAKCVLKTISNIRLHQVIKGQ